MSHINIQYYKSKIGELILGSFNDELCLVDFKYRRMRNTIDNRIKNGLNSEFTLANNSLLDRTRSQLSEYFAGDRHQFNLPLLMVGTEFQQAVWNTLLQLPYGSTTTYQDLANSIGHSNAVRAVGSANGANCIAVIIPCHRVIGGNGDLAGYAGGLPVKKRLLKLESEG